MIVRGSTVQISVEGFDNVFVPELSLRQGPCQLLHRTCQHLVGRQTLHLYGERTELHNVDHQGSLTTEGRAIELPIALCAAMEAHLHLAFPNEAITLCSFVCGSIRRSASAEKGGK